MANVTRCVVLLLSILIAGTAAAAESPTAAPAPAKFKVGVLVSKGTAEGPSWKGEPYGWGHANAAKRLVDPQVELYAIVDPGTADDEEVVKAINKSFPAEARKRIVDGGDEAALAKLDVIVAHHIANIDEQQVAAMIKAISGGVRMINIGAVGTVTPGYTADVNQLNIMGDDATYAWRGDDQPCEFARGIKEALLGDAPSKKPDEKADGDAADKATIKIKPNGVMGTLKPGTVPVMQLTADAAALSFPKNPAPAGATFYVMLMGELGKGHILLCNIYVSSPSLDKAAGGGFLLKAVKAMGRMKAQ